METHTSLEAGSSVPNSVFPRLYSVILVYAYPASQFGTAGTEDKHIYMRLITNVFLLN